MAVYDMEATRKDLIDRGVEVSEFFHRGLGEELERARPGRSLLRDLCGVQDPDGNSWLLQEIKERLPGRS